MNDTRGFTLAEVAIVLLILSLLGGGALAALRLQTQYARLSETRNQLGEAREALLNYAAIERRLPCPDADDDGEPDCARPCVPRCGLPWAALGLPARDPWGHALRYQPSNGFATAATLNLSSVGTLGIADGAGRALANKEAVAFAVWSTGPDGRDNTQEGRPQQLAAESPYSDDLVQWSSRYVLLGRMLEAGWEAPLPGAPHNDGGYSNGIGF